MSAFTRRDLCQRLPLLALLPSVAAEAQQAAAPAKTCVEPVLEHCKAFPFETLPIRYSAGGAATRQILEGKVPTGEIIELHETTIAPGKMPHAAHRHPHAELLLVRSGTIEFQTEKEAVRVTPGGAAYCAPGELHGFKNVGETDAVYFVMKVGAVPVCQT